MPLPFYPCPRASRFLSDFMSIRACISSLISWNSIFMCLMCLNSVFQMVLGQNKTQNVRTHPGVYHQLTKDKKQQPKKKKTCTQLTQLKNKGSFRLFVRGLSRHLFFPEWYFQFLLSPCFHYSVFVFFFSLYCVRNMLRWLMHLELTLWSSAAFSLPVARPRWFKAKKPGWSYRAPLGDSCLQRSWLSVFWLVFLAAVCVAPKAPSHVV